MQGDELALNTHITSNHREDCREGAARIIREDVAVGNRYADCSSRNPARSILALEELGG